jgi:hypothetical protein
MPLSSYLPRKEEEKQKIKIPLPFSIGRLGGNHLSK